MSRSTPLALAALIVGVAAANAQSAPGITFKIRTQLKNHQNVEKSKPDSVRLARQAAAAAARAADITDAAAGGGDGGGRAGGPAGGGGAGTNNVLTMNGSFVKGIGKMEVLGVQGNPELAATQTAVFTDTSSTIMDDVAQTYWPRVFDIGSILAFTTAIDAAVPRVATLKASWQPMPDSTIDGRTAKHYQLNMSYGLKQAPRPDSSKLLAITTVVSDYWVVDLPVNFENRFAGIGRPRKQVPDSLRGEWDKILKLYVELGKGTIVKFNAAGTIGENAERATEYTRTMEMTNIKATPLDPATLKVPEGFKLSPPQGRGGPPG